MNDKQKLISTLLSRYYDGSATQAEAAMLRQMLDSLTESELTAELRMERDLLRALYDQAPADASYIPDNLEARLVAATIGAESKTKTPRRRSAWLYAAAVAASLVLVLGLAWRFTGSHDSVTTDNAILVAQVVETSDTVAATIPVQPVDTLDSHDDAQPTPAVTRRIAPRPGQARVASASAFKEVTDSAEAVRITRKVFDTLGRALAQADKCTGPVSKSVDEAGRQIENASRIIEQSLI